MRKSIAGNSLRWLSASLAAGMFALAGAVAASTPTPYVAYRSTLLHSGWRPDIVIVVFADGTRERDWGDARNMKEFGFIEIERCTGVERNFCFFNFRKGRMCKRVTTVGEFTRDGSYPRVTTVETARCSKIRR
jgi:hypothetical protein